MSGKRGDTVWKSGRVDGYFIFSGSMDTGKMLGYEARLQDKKREEGWSGFFVTGWFIYAVRFKAMLSI